MTLHGVRSAVSPRAPLEGAIDDWDWSAIRARCRREALRILRRPDDADEAVQEALVRAWRSRQLCLTPEAPLPWCLQITRNEALRRIGRGPERWGMSLDLLRSELTDDVSLSERERADDRIDLGRALAELSPAERLLIALRYELDCSHPQIAERLQIPETTARVRLHRARKRLKTLLEDRN